MTEFFDPDTLASFVRASGHAHVGIDGINGAGKTTLATQLSSRLGYRLLSLDTFLEKNQGGFVQHLKYPELRASIAGADNFVIEGVCLLEVLHRLKIDVQFLAYIKRRQHGLWADERECEIEGNVEKFIEDEKELVKRLGSPEGPCEGSRTLGLGEKIIRYHASYKPHQKANAIFWRDDC